MKWIIGLGLQLGVFGCGTLQVSPTEHSPERSSHAELPGWLENGQTDACPLGHVCRVGVGRQFDDLDRAIHAARNDAYSSLAYDAFPVEIRGELEIEEHHSYVDQTESDHGTVDSTIHSRVWGRIHSARTIDIYWICRVEEQLRGPRDVFDAWVLVGIPEDVLKNAYPEALQQARQDLAAITEKIDSLERQLETTEDINLSSMLQMYRYVNESLCNLPDVEGLAEARIRLFDLRQRLRERISVTVISLERLDNGLLSRVALGVTFEGRAQHGVSLTIEGADGCPGHIESAVTEHRFLVSHTSCRLPCELSITLEETPDFQHTITIPARYEHTCVSASVSIDGFAASDVRSNLRDLDRRLVSENTGVETVKPVCDEPTSANITLSVEVSLNSPHQLDAHLHSVGGAVHVEMLLDDELLFEEYTRVRAVGSNHDQLVEGVSRNLTQVVLESFTRGLGNL